MDDLRQRFEDMKWGVYPPFGLGMDLRHYGWHWHDRAIFLAGRELRALTRD